MLKRSGGGLGLNNLKRHYAHSTGQLNANNLETETDWPTQSAWNAAQ